MKARCGFTLIELAVVLFIVSLVLVGLLGPLSTRLEQEDRERATEQLREIEEALYGFAMINGRLPCPDEDGDGMEDRAGGPPLTCLDAAGAFVAFSSGGLPWVDLGVSAADPWGRAFVYGVTTAFADDQDGAPGIAGAATPSCSGTPPLNVSFELCSAASGTVLDAAGGANVVTGVPAIAISYGANGATPFAELSAHEQENQDGDSTAVLKEFSREPTLEFDDQLIWISPNILRNRMLVAARLP
jgi:prepilin-type N-terminal cleavage/methylation domain-containing protein